MAGKELHDTMVAKDALWDEAKQYKEAFDTMVRLENKH